MKTYTVHLPAGTTGTSDIAERAIFVRDGFAWWALFFPLFWLLWHRLWITLAIFVAFSVIIGVAGESLSFGGPLALAAGLVVNVLVAAEGNDLRRWKLARKGFELAGIVRGRTLEEAELRFFDETLASALPTAAPGGDAAPGVAREPAAPRTAPSGLTSTEPEVIGLFPQPENAR